MNELPIQNLDGYLLSLRRLSNNQCDFWAEIFELSDGIENSFKKHLSGLDVTLLSHEPVGYRDIDAILNDHLFSKLIGLSDPVKKLFAWDIVEYLQMSYREIDPEIDPISSKEALLFNAVSEFHGKYIYIVIPVVNCAVAVGLATRA